MSTIHTKTQRLFEKWFPKHEPGFTVPPLLPDFNPTWFPLDVVKQKIGNMDVQPTNLQLLCDAFRSIQIKISGEVIQNLQ